jgi:phage shock protein A|tara:strand:- start:2754 stop:2903 length:150 start_codon:yes stop_codon:yes gene_type:complete
MTNNREVERENWIEKLRDCRDILRLAIIDAQQALDLVEKKINKEKVDEV